MNIEGSACRPVSGRLAGFGRLWFLLDLDVVLETLEADGRSLKLKPTKLKKRLPVAFNLRPRDGMS